MKNGKPSIISWKSSKNKIEKLAYFTSCTVVLLSKSQDMVKRNVSLYVKCPELLV